MNSKKLHQHAVPVLLAGVAGFIAAVGVSGIVASNKSGDYRAALTSRAFSVKPTSGVTAEIAPTRLNQPTLTDEAAALAGATTVYFALNTTN